jgi:hypothetical protein
MLAVLLHQPPVAGIMVMYHYAWLAVISFFLSVYGLAMAVPVGLLDSLGISTHSF